jgi:hypothetical protein
MPHHPNIQYGAVTSIEYVSLSIGIYRMYNYIVYQNQYYLISCALRRNNDYLISPAWPGAQSGINYNIMSRQNPMSAIILMHSPSGILKLVKYRCRNVVYCEIPVKAWPNCRILIWSELIL